MQLTNDVIRLTAEGSMEYCEIGMFLRVVWRRKGTENRWIGGNMGT